VIFTIYEIFNSDAALALNMRLEEAKLRAAEKALKMVKDGMVLGLGSGSTVAKFIKLLGEKIGYEFTEIYGVPSSYDTEILAREVGIKIVSLNDYFPDLAVDGADEVDRDFNLIKGGGGCHTREKIVDYSSGEFVVIVDYTKLVTRLGLRKPIPIEVLPFALRLVIRTLSRLGRAEIRRCKGGKLGPVVTDNGNFIVDLNYGRPIEDIEALDRELKSIPGVIETGLFYGSKVSKVVVGYPDRAEILFK